MRLLPKLFRWGMKCMAICFILSMYQTVEASQLDKLRNIIESKHYFMKYTVEMGFTQSASIKHQLQSGMVMGGNIQIGNAPDEYVLQYIIVCDGDKIYAEQSMGEESARCYLQQGDQVFEFNRFTPRELEKPLYMSTYGRSNKIAARQRVKADEEARYGSLYMERIINALFPYKEKNDFELLYHEDGSGFTEDGLRYFDLKAEKSQGEGLDVIRYYFDGDCLVKISHASAFKYQEKTEVNRVVINITNFSEIPNQSYLTLPKELKVIS